jgi:capsular exopolysaccharide synthesis family protein
LSVASATARTAETASEPTAVRAPAARREAVETASPAPSQFEEAFRTLRSNVLLLASTNVRIILVASAMPSEGKSTVAANLACSLSALGMRVLLIDGDLRRPRLHQLFQVRSTPGLAEVLQGTDLAESTWHETMAGPFLLTSGELPGDPQALFESGEFDRLLSVARGEFDFVLIDSAPLLSVADTTLIAPRVDGVIVVMKYAAVSEAEARTAFDRLHAARGKVLGCVVSQVTETAGSFYAYDREYLERR